MKKPREDCVLKVGEYIYSFKFQLLSTLPTSFESSFGKIHYLLIGSIHVPW